MPRCTGCTGTCYCVIEAGPNIQISGNGNDEPFVISSNPDGAAGGMLDYTPHTTDYVLTTGYTDVVSLTVSTVAGRRYKITGHVHGSLSGAVGDYQVHARLVEGATVFSKDRMSNTGFSGAAEALHMEAIVAPAASSHTYKIQAFTDPTTGGSGLISDASTGPGFLIVEDIGSV